MSGSRASRHLGVTTKDAPLAAANGWSMTPGARALRTLPGLDVGLRLLVTELS